MPQAEPRKPTRRRTSPADSTSEATTRSSRSAAKGGSASADAAVALRGEGKRTAAKKAASKGLPSEKSASRKPRPAPAPAPQALEAVKAAKAPKTTPPRGRAVRVGRSGVHGKGVFAGRPFAAGDTVMEYRGEVITWREALRRHPHDPKDPFHTFYFHIDDKRVIDGKVHGNAARWINHACEPNCETDEVDGRVFIRALRDLALGEELFYDYHLVVEERYTPRVKQQYACHCGAPGCRGTMLAPKR